MRRSPFAFLVFAIASAGHILAPSVGRTAEQGDKGVDEKTAAAVRRVIEEYIRLDTGIKGRFLIVDHRTDQALLVTYDHLHEGVKPHEKGYVSCADFKDRDGTLYDVDIVVGGAKADLRVEDVFLHKVDGNPVPAPGEKHGETNEDDR